MTNNLKIIINKMESFCAYQERSVFEIEEKLKKEDISDIEKKMIISSLVENNYLNEKRFVEAYITGKIRIKKWGKLKIIAHLQQKRINKNIIEEIFNQIDNHDYEENIQHLILRKKEELEKKETNPLIVKQKLFRYLLSKGYKFEDFSKFVK